VLGLDDFAWKKGDRYGTLLVDLEARCPVDLLPDREAASVARWLREHPGVKLISRDRAGMYAEGVKRGAPRAKQIGFPLSSVGQSA
jgi:transposase